VDLDRLSFRTRTRPRRRCNSSDFEDEDDDEDDWSTLRYRDVVSYEVSE
jgi:hypothetical protein